MKFKKYLETFDAQIHDFLRNIEPTKQNEFLKKNWQGQTSQNSARTHTIFEEEEIS